MTAMEHPGRREWVTDFKNEFPGEGSPTELPDGGLTGPSGDEDGNAGALPAPECP